MGVGCWLGKTQTHSTVSVFDTVSNTCRNYVKSMYKLSSFYDVMTRCFARFKAALRGRAVKLSLIFGFVSTINIQDTAVYCLIRSTDMKKRLYIGFIISRSYLNIYSGQIYEDLQHVLNI